MSNRLHGIQVKRYFCLYTSHPLRSEELFSYLRLLPMMILSNSTSKTLRTTGFAFPPSLDTHLLSGRWLGHPWVVILHLPATIRPSGYGGGWQSTNGNLFLFLPVMKGVYTASAGAEGPVIERIKSGWGGWRLRAEMARY